MNTELLTVLRGKNRQNWEQLLRSSGLEPEELPQQTVLLWDDNTLAATGSRQGNLLKYLAIAPGYQGQGLLATILTAPPAGCIRLRSYRRQQGSFCGHIFSQPIVSGSPNWPLKAFWMRSASLPNPVL